MGHRKQQVELVLSKPLKKLLRQWLEPRQSRLDKRLEALEQRLERLERQRSSPQSGSDDSATLDVGIFLTDADADDERPGLSRNQQDSYQAWERHYNLHPEDLEPGRTVHEMAALKAATQSPISRTGIDQQG